MVGGVSGWAKTILFFLLLAPVCASIIACTPSHCSNISDETFLQLDQEKGGHSLSFWHSIGCELLNRHPLGVFSWSLSGQPSCPELRARETLKLLSGIAARDDFETLAGESQQFKRKTSFDDGAALSDFPELHARVTDLEESLSDTDSKDTSLASALNTFEGFKAHGVSACASFLESFIQGLLKEGKKSTMARVNEWAKEQEGDG